MVQPRGVVGHDAAEPGEVVGWAKVKPDTLRFAAFSSPRTAQQISGLCCELERSDPDKIREVWINNRNGWKRAEGWMRNAFIKKLDAEEQGSNEDMPLPAEEEVGQF